MYRTQVYLRQDQHNLLKREARRKGLSMTGLLRDLIDRFTASLVSRAGPNLALVTALGRGRDPDAALGHDETFGRAAANHPAGRPSPAAEGGDPAAGRRPARP